MEQRKLYSRMMLIAVAALLIISCSKEESGTIPEEDIALAKNEAFVDAMFDDMDNMVLAEVKTLDNNDYSSQQLKSTSVNICYSVTVNHPDTTTFPKIITIDFGEGCSIVYNEDTITRSGKIIVTLTDRWFMPNAQHILTFENFYFNGIKVEGTRTITNLGLNNKLHLEVGILLENGKITFPDARYITREAEHLCEYAFYLNPMNDTIWITGTADGINILGEEYSRTISEPIVFKRCQEYEYKWTPVDGKIDITNSVRGQMSISYEGDGCTESVIVEKDGNRFTWEFSFRN